MDSVKAHRKYINFVAFTVNGGTQGVARGGFKFGLVASGGSLIRVLLVEYGYGLGVHVVAKELVQILLAPLAAINVEFSVFL